MGKTMQYTGYLIIRSSLFRHLFYCEAWGDLFKSLSGSSCCFKFTLRKLECSGQAVGQ